jgi:hypothetical protein
MAGANQVNTTLPGLINNNPHVDVWQAFNEPFNHLGDSQFTYDWLTNHDKAVIDVAKAADKDACIGNFKEGFPSDPDSLAFRNYATAIMDHTGSQGMTGNVYLCVHEHEDSQNNWGFGNRYNGRFTQLLGSDKLQLPVLVTVAGFDSKAGTDDSGDGWKDAGLDKATYRQMLLDYQFAAKSHGAVGVAVFQLGLGGTWASFDIEDLLTP